ncbi:MAG: thiamine pyrophosphate-binding protein, partial [Rhodospirillales bacterium]|nr:thiamine pyrophosphate-binding protein [Rhodospirillales bacterium]
MPSQNRTGGEILADALLHNGADTVFCVPGESYLPFLDAAHDRAGRLRLVTARHEGGASYMAEAYGKLTGKPGLCFVTRGPGACNASIGVHVAFQDSTAMVLMVGQVERAFRGREAFQEVEYRLMFAPLAKWVVEVDSAARIPETMARALAIAQNGRPGPVVVVFPEDVRAETATVPDVPPAPLPRAYPGASQIEDLKQLLTAAQRPLAIVGGGGWTAQAASGFTAFAEAWNLPTAASFRCQDIIDNRKPIYAGELGTSVSPALARRVREADVLLVAGARLGEMTTQGYTLVEAPQPRQILLHIHPDPQELGRIYRPSLAIAAGMPELAESLGTLPAPPLCVWDDWTAATRHDYEAGLVPGPCPGTLHMGEVMAMIEARLPDDAIICTGAGNYTGWPQRFHQFRRFRSQLGVANGSMGYGVPAAIAARIAQPERCVVVFAGDGCFQMNGQEMATAMQEGLSFVILLINNAMYGTIRMHQERDYPERVSATRLVNPDFAALARAFGAHGEVVERTEDFAAAFERALGAGKLA